MSRCLSMSFRESSSCRPDFNRAVAQSGSDRQLTDDSQQPAGREAGCPLWSSVPGGFTYLHENTTTKSMRTSEEAERPERCLECLGGLGVGETDHQQW